MKPVPARAASSWAVLVTAAATALTVAGCNSTHSNKNYMGLCEPTVEGSPPGNYANYDAARKAFGRSTPDGSFSAYLEDVAWLRYEGEEEEVVKNHRPYFDQGYTTFMVTLFTKDFVQPTAETYVLEDSGGARLAARPQTYNGNMGLENERYAARFSISFRHAITRNLEWMSLTRSVDGARLEWTFPAGIAAEAKRANANPDPPPPSVTKGTLPKAMPLRRPLNPAPGGCDPGAPFQKPVNLLTHPEAGPQRGPSTMPFPTEPPAGMPPPAPPANATLESPGVSSVPPPVASAPPRGQSPSPAPSEAPPAGPLPPLPPPESRPVR